VLAEFIGREFRLSPPVQRVLVFNFFNGIKERGIPLYARELEKCFERIGIGHVELACPRWARRLHPGLLNLLFVAFEQIVAPLMALWRGCSVTVYPYNSCSVIDALLGRSVMVVHDLISNERASRGLAAAYIRSTQIIHCALRRPVCAVSEHTLKTLRRLERYAQCPLYLWSNPFYAFEETVARLAGETPPPRAQRILLCSGVGPNKDFVGALQLFQLSADLHEAELRVVGFGADAFLARRRLDRLPASITSRITVLARLSIDELVREYRDCDLVWVHSKKEGFGRPVVEARISGRCVLASNISAFRQLKRLGCVNVYRQENFGELLAHRLVGPAQCHSGPLSAVDLHLQLEGAVATVMRRHFGGNPL
jgi:glycosyltransferase involved in cell wall biosynthesis